MAKMTDIELKAVLQAEKWDALGSIKASNLSLDRSQAMKYYLGDMTDDMPQIEGRSTAVSTDVADSIEGLMPSLMEIFAGSDQVVRFDPTSEQDIPQAEQETDYVNHVFMDVNQGFLVLYHMIKDALLSKVGIVKVWWEEQEIQEKDTYYDQPDDAYALIASDPDLEVIEHSENKLTDPVLGPVTLHDVTVMRTKKQAYARCDPVPPEEFGISRRARMDMQECAYMYHEVVKTQARLIDMGFDEDQVDKLMTYADIPHAGAASEIYARDTVFEFAERDGDEGINRANRPIRVTEHYIRLDYEQDGKPRIYRITTAGEDTEILYRDGKLDVEEIEWFPFAAITPFIQTHRFFGRSVADVTMDIQRIKTALTRGVLDNTYLNNNPRTEVPDAAVGPNTLDDLLTSRPGGIIRTKQPGMLNPIQTPSIVGNVLPLIQYFDSTREWRTGVSRQGQGLDVDALQNQTATAAQQVYNASQARMKLIARVFAETGIRDLFWLLHSTIRKYGDQAETVRLRNQWVTVDPRRWRARDQLTVHVGLGSGGKTERLQQVMTVIGLQTQAVQAGLTAMVTPKNLYNSFVEVCKLLEFKDVDAFAKDPGDADFPPPPQDPNVAKTQAQAQLDQQKAQTTAQLEQAKMQMQAQFQEAQLAKQTQIEQAQAQTAMQTQQQKAQTEAQLAQQKFELDKQLKMLEFQLREREMNMKNEQMKQQAASKEKPGSIVVTDGKGMSDLGEQFKSVMDAHRAHSEQTTNAITGMVRALQEQNERHAKMMAAPKRVVRGKTGRVEGVETVMEP